MTPQVFWAALLERTVQDHAVGTLLDVAADAGAKGYTRILWPYSRTDIARNFIIREFRQRATDPHDALVMLDCDHLMPPDVITRLLKWEQGVVGALAFRRGPPYFPCFFLRHGDTYAQALEFEPGLIACALVGTGAICIRRSVFDALDDAGYTWPYFRYLYPPNETTPPSEDIYFGRICEQAGIPHYVDTTFEIPHLSTATIGSESWQQWQADHPELRTTAQEVTISQAVAP